VHCNRGGDRHRVPPNGAGESHNRCSCFLVAVLIVSAFWGLQYSVFVAILATLAFNYYFLPPYGTLTISDPQNWIALVAFLATALIASELSEKARRQALVANQRRKEIERLYGFSQQLLTTENLPELLNLLPRFVVDGFGVGAAALFVTGRRTSTVPTQTPSNSTQSASGRSRLAANPRLISRTEFVSPRCALG